MDSPNCVLFKHSLYMCCKSDMNFKLYIEIGVDSLRDIALTLNASLIFHVPKAQQVVIRKKSGPFRHLDIIMASLLEISETLCS